MQQGEGSLVSGQYLLAAGPYQAAVNSRHQDSAKIKILSFAAMLAKSTAYWLV
jgi:hypothetical protein